MPYRLGLMDSATSRPISPLQVDGYSTSCPMRASEYLGRSWPERRAGAGEILLACDRYG